jgi:hypothetical protein
MYGYERTYFFCVSNGVSKWNVMGYNVLSIILGMGEVCVLLSVGILPKLLVYCFINGVILFNAKLGHVYILFAG